MSFSNRALAPAVALATVLVLSTSAHAAGDVTAELVGRDLVLTGDDAGNRFRISQPFPNEYVVTGLAGTTINGQATLPIDFTGHVIVRLGDGLNQVEIRNAVRNLTIFGGTSADNIRLENAFVNGRLKIFTGAGDDDITITSGQLARKVKIDTGDGGDVVAFSSTAAQAKVVVKTGAGRDAVALNGAVTRKVFKVKLDDGDDVLTVSNSSVARLRASGGTGSDNGQQAGSNTFRFRPRTRGFEFGSL